MRPDAQFLASTFGAKLITADGNVRPVTPANGTDFSLEELQEFVGGDFLEAPCQLQDRGKISPV